MKIVTGSLGEPHVTSAQAGDMHEGIFGRGTYVLDVGSCFSATRQANDILRISDGSVIFEGRHGIIERGETEDVVISLGTSGFSRYSYIMVRYTNAGGVESMGFSVIDGTEVASGTPPLPTYTANSIREGNTEAQTPLYKVLIENQGIKNFELVPRIVPSLNTATKVTPSYTSGVKLATVTSGDVRYDIYEPKPSYTAVASSGTKLGTLSVDGSSFNIYKYATTWSGSYTSGTKLGTLSADNKTFTIYKPATTYTTAVESANGTKIGTLKADGASTVVYAPKVVVTPSHTSGTKIGTVLVGATSKALYHPNASYITSETTSGSWRIRKWSNNRVECWGSFLVKTTAQGTALGNAYYWDTGGKYLFPNNLFASAPIVLITPHTNNGGLFAITTHQHAADGVAFYTWAPHQKGGIDLNVHIYALGVLKT